MPGKDRKKTPAQLGEIKNVIFEKVGKLNIILITTDSIKKPDFLISSSNQEKSGRTKAWLSTHFFLSVNGLIFLRHCRKNDVFMTNAVAAFTFLNKLGGEHP